MNLRTKLEDLRKTPSLAPTAAEYRALLELALAVEAVESAQLAMETSRRATPDADRCLIHNDLTCAYFDMRTALARLAEAVK